MDYTWKRYVFEQAKELKFQGDNYPYDPEEPYGHILQPNVFEIEKIHSIPCVVLLGEPGLGKSYSLNQMSQNAKQQGDTTLNIKLRSVHSDYSLDQELFLTDQFKNWLDHKEPLHLFLDSLDEGLLQAEDLAIRLSDKLMKYKDTGDFNNLFLRISCRPYDWAKLSLEQTLNELYSSGKDNGITRNSFKVLKLMQLRYKDIVLALKSENIENINDFMGKINKKNLVSLSIMPVTLKLLIKIYKETGSFPSNISEIYQRGCLEMCKPTETDVIRINRYNCSSEERLKIAASIAFLMLLSNKTYIALDLSELDMESVTLYELSSALYELNGETNNNLYNTENIKETLSSGLFTSNARNLFEWTQQVYVEFLAAYFISIHGIEPIKIINIAIAADGSNKITPQLIEFIKWSALFSKDILQHIISHQPDLLWHNNLFELTDSIKEQLIINIFEQVQKGRIDQWDYYSKRSQLFYPGIDQRLLEYIQSENLEVRSLALVLVAEYEINTLDDTMLNIATNEDEGYSIRNKALSAYMRIVKNPRIDKLKTLVFSMGTNDSSNPLKEKLLAYLFPRYINADTFFELAKLKDYGVFNGNLYLLEDLCEKVSSEDVLSALKWMNNQFPQNIESIMYNKHFEKIYLRFMNHSLGQLNNKEVLSLYLKNIIKEMEEQIDPAHLGEDVESNDNRYLIIEYLIEHYPFELKEKNLYLYPWIYKKDIEWILKNVEKSISEEQKNAWEKVLLHYIDSYGFDDAERLISLYKRFENNEMIEEVLSYRMKPIELNSNIANRLRKQYTEQQQFQNKRKNFETSMREKEEEMKKKFNKSLLDLSGELNIQKIGIWKEIVDVLETEINRHVYRNHIDLDITALENWEKIGPVYENIILENAKNYISSSFFIKSSSGNDLLAYRAIRFIFAKEMSYLKILDQKQWEKLISLCWSRYSASEDSQQHNELLKFTYNEKPKEVVKVLKELLRGKYHHNASNNLSLISNKEIEKELFNFVNRKRKKNLYDKVVFEIYKLLLKNNFGKAEQSIQNLIKQLLNRESRLINELSALFLEEKGDVAWCFLAPILAENPTFSKRLFREGINDYNFYEIINKLKDDYLAALYLMLKNLFPLEELPIRKAGVAFSPTKKEEISHYRERIIQRLRDQGSQSAIVQLKKISSLFPEEKCWNKVISVAEENYRRHNWSPLTEKQLIQIITKDRARIIQSEEQLVEVLLEALSKIEKEFHDITPSIEFLWNKIDKRKYSPKEENLFSDYLKIRLQEILNNHFIVVNREVEIKSNRGSFGGERTDLHINAFIKREDGTREDDITLIIEVKGNWHEELLDAMNSQLFQRYMGHEGCDYGVYLVGWFGSELWEKPKSMSKKVRDMSYETAKKYFRDQSEKISNEKKKVYSFVMDMHL